MLIRMLSPSVVPSVDLSYIHFARTQVKLSLFIASCYGQIFPQRTAIGIDDDLSFMLMSLKLNVDVV